VFFDSVSCRPSGLPGIADVKVARHLDYAFERSARARSHPAVDPDDLRVPVRAAGRFGQDVPDALGGRTNATVVAYSTIDHAHRSIVIDQ
jgi:hypothetical protein